MSYPYSDMKDATEQMMDVAEVAKRLGVGERFVRRLVEERRISYFKIGRHVRFMRHDVDGWISESRVERLQALPATVTRLTRR